MAPSMDLDAARETFIEAVTRYDQFAPPISREAVEATAKSICKTSNVCTNANIQHSKGLVVAHTFTSPGRVAALKEYIITLSKHFCPRDLDSRVDTTKPGDENEGLGKIINGKVQQPPQPAYKRLHLLYLLHDIVMDFHAHIGGGGSDWSSRDRSERHPILEQLRPLATTLARLAVCGCTGKAAKTQDTVPGMVTIWKGSGLFSSVECDDISQLVREAIVLDWNDMLSSLAGEDAKTKAKGAIEDGFDWVLPPRHSNIDDSNAPWHELPAANGLFMKRTRGFPLRAVAFPNGGYDIEGAGNQADAELKQEVTTLYKDMMRCYDKYTELDDVQDIDALGNVIWKDADRPTRNYWGWTLDGIERRKDLAARFAEEAGGYGDMPDVRPAGVNSAVERARMLAAERNGGGGGDRGFGFDMGGGAMGGDRDPSFERGRSGFRGGNRGGFRGGHRGDFRGGYRGRPRW